MSKNKNFEIVLMVELLILAIGMVCMLPSALILTRVRPSSAQAATPTPPGLTVQGLQTLAADIVSTQTALEQPGAAGPGIPVTGAQATQTPGDGLVRVTFIDVGQGQATLIQSPEGKFALIDGGPAGGGALKYLQSHGVTGLEAVVVTVPQPEHIGGLADILNTIPTAKVYTNGQPVESLDYKNFLDAIAASGAEYLTVRRGDSIFLGSLRLEVIHPGTIFSQDIDVNSLALRMVHEKTTFLFAGDTTDVADQEMLGAVYPLKATILAIGRHASKNSTSPAFLGAVAPLEAVYSPGRGGSDQISPETLKMFENAGVEVDGTDTYGTIMVLSGPNGYTLARQFETARIVVTPAGISGAPAQNDLRVVVTELTSPVKVGQPAAISIETSPGAVCGGLVRFPSGLGGSANLGLRATDQSGNIRWAWQVGENATPGSFLIDVLCGVEGKSAGGVIPFVVSR